MHIIIVGCGKVGETIAQQLQGNEYDLTLIDTDEMRLNRITEDIDAMGVCGNGASNKTLEEAGIEDAEFLIAVTGSDEVNLLSCVAAQKVSNCKTIAKVSNPVYHSEMKFFKERLGIHMIINPEYEAAHEISRLLRFPSAINIDILCRGHAELLKFKVEPEFGMDNMTLSEMMNKYRCNILVCGAERKKEIVIPGGNYVIKDGDFLTILAAKTSATAFFKKIGLNTKSVKNCIIAGGGKTAYYLAGDLVRYRILVKIIEHNQERCEELSEEIPEATIIHGDCTDQRLLMEEGLPNAESFVTLTEVDEENVFLALRAKSLFEGKTIAKINRSSYDDIIDKLEIGSVVNPKSITADMILQQVRATQNTVGSNVETLYHIMDNRAEVLEFAITSDSKATGIPLMDLKLKKNLLVGGIFRDGSLILPRGGDRIQVGDTVVIVTTQQGLNDIDDILDKR